MRLARAALVAVLALLPACTVTKDYVHDRAADLVDVLRLHLFIGDCLAAEVQVTQWVGVGFVHEANVRAFGLHNRALGTWNETITAYGLILHNWKEQVKGIPTYSGSYGWWQRSNQGGPSFSHKGDAFDLWNIRATAAILVGADVEVRLAELFDFIVGLTTWDPADDDG